MPIDAPEADGRPLPRRWQYPVGWNLPVGVPGSEGYKLASFAALRKYADVYSVVRAMINIRKNEMAGLEWDIGPTAAAQSETKGDKGAAQDQRDRSAKLVQWFKKIDSNYYGFQSWFEALLEDLFVIDAVSLHLLPTRLKGKGLYGANIAELELLNGETIRPLMNLRGATPKPPNVAYQQFIWGVPRTDLMSIIEGADLDEIEEQLTQAGISDDVEPEKEYAADQLLYLPRSRRTWTPYGFSAIEQALLPITLGLKRQEFLLDFFTDGTIPGVYVIAGDQYVTPAQQRQLQDSLNALAGDQAWKHRVIVLPPGSKTDPQKDMSWQQQVDQTIVEQVAMILHIQMHEISMLPGGRSSGLGGKGQAEQAADEVSRTRTEPDRSWFKATIFDWLIQKVFGQDDLEWKWLAFEEEEDDQKAAEVATKFIAMGRLTIDEDRIENGLDPYNLPLTKSPFLLAGQQVIPLDPTVPPPPPPPAPAPAFPEMGPDGKPLPPKPGAAPGAAPHPGFPPKPAAGGMNGPQPPRPGTPQPGAKPGAGPLPAKQPGAAPRQPAAASKSAAGGAQGASSDETPLTDEQGMPVTHHDGTPATVNAQGRMSEPASGVLFDDDTVDGLLDVTDSEVETLLDESMDQPKPVEGEGGTEEVQAAPAVNAGKAAKPDPKAKADPKAQPTQEDQPPKYVFGNQTPAYTSGATNDDIRTEVGAIKQRATAAGGEPPAAAEVIATFQRNLLRKVRAAIIAKAVQMFGQVPSKAAVDATMARWQQRWLAKLTEAAQREMRAHNHDNHAQNLAHEKHLAQMHIDHVARGQEQRAGLDRRGGVERRSGKRYKVANNRRSGDDRRQTERRGSAESAESAVSAPKLSVATLTKGRIKYKDSKLPQIVHDYLLRSYPEKDVEWALDPDIKWEYEPHQPLSDVNDARRPGGRDPKKVTAIGDSLRQGASMDPLVYIEYDTPPNPGKPIDIADGWHRSLGAKDANWSDVPAFIGRHTPDKYRDLISGQMQNDSDSKKKAAVAELAVLRRFVRKGGLVENFRTTALDPDIMRMLAADITKGGRDSAFETARGWISKAGGNPEALREWFNEGADGQIDWGSPGDFDSCVSVAGKYMDNPEGYCNLRHQDAVGGAPGTEDKVAGEGRHLTIAELQAAALKYSEDEPRDEAGRWASSGDAPIRRSGSAELRDGRVVRVNGFEPDGRLLVEQRGPAGESQTFYVSREDVRGTTKPLTRDPINKDFSLSAPLATGFVPYDLVGQGTSSDTTPRRCKNCGTALIGQEREVGLCGDCQVEAATGSPYPFKGEEADLLKIVEAELARRGIELADKGETLRGWAYVEEGENTKKGTREDGSPGIAGVVRDGKRYGVGVGKDDDGVFVMTHRARSKSYPTLDDIPTKVLEFIDETG